MHGKATSTASDHGQLRFRPPPSHRLTPASASKLDGSKEPKKKEYAGAKAVTPPATPPARAAAGTTHTQPSSRATNAVTAAAAHHSSRMRQAGHATSSLACRTFMSHVPDRSELPRQPTRQPSLPFAPSPPQAATATASRTTRNAARHNVSTDRKRRKPRTSAPGKCTRSSALDTASQVACACGAVTRRSWHGGAGTAERYAGCRCRASARAGRRQSG